MKNPPRRGTARHAPRAAEEFAARFPYSGKGGHIFQVGSVYGAKTSTSIGGGGSTKKLPQMAGKTCFEKLSKALIQNDGVLTFCFIILKHFQ